MNHCNSRLVLFSCRHSHSYISTTFIFYCKCIRCWPLFFSHLSHGLLVLFVEVFTLVQRAVMTMPITPVKLIYGLCLRVKTIHGKFSIADTLFCIVQLVVDMDAFFVSHPFELLNRHLHRTFRFEVVFRQASCVTSGWHILHNSPEVQSISVISHDL